MNYLEPQERWIVTKKHLSALPEHEKPRFAKKSIFALTASRHTIEIGEDSPDILKLCIWTRDELLLSVYIDANALWGGRDITYVHTESRWSKGDICRNMAHIPHGYEYRRSGVLHIPEPSRAVIASYFDDSTTAPLELIEKELQRHRSARYQHRTDARLQRAARIAAQRKPLPHDFDRWINNHLFEDERYIIYHRVGKNIIGRCSHCGNDVTIRAVKGMKHGYQLKCPSCGKKVSLYAGGRSSRNVICAGRYAIVANRIDEGLLLRCIYVRREIDINTAARKDKHYAERALYVVGTKEDVSLELINDYKGGKEYWDKARVASMCHTPYFRTGMLYTANLHNELRGTIWQYSALELLPHAVDVVDGRDISNYLEAATKDKMVERLMRVGLYRLACHSERYYGSRYYLSGARDFVDANEPKLHRALGVRRCDLKVLRRLNVDKDELKLYRMLINSSDDPEKFMLSVRKNNLMSTHNGAVQAVIRKMGVVAAERLVYSYAPAQCKLHPDVYPNMRSAVSDYRDYIGQCSELNRDMNDTSNMWPADLHKRHEDLTKLIRRRKSATEDKAINRRWKKEHRDYEYSASGFRVIMPRNGSEIIAEGKKMCHCVATYTARVAKGDTTILFVRAVDDPDTPLATAEVCDGRTLQIRAKNNRTPSDEVMAFWNEYEKNVLKPLFAERNKIQVKVG